MTGKRAELIRTIKSMNDIHLNNKEIEHNSQENHWNEEESEAGTGSEVSFRVPPVRSDGQCKGYAQMVNLLPSFSGIDPIQSVDDWIDKIEEFGTMYEWDDVTIRHYGLLKMEDVAKEWRDSVKNVNRSWKQWKILLYENFPSSDSVVQKRRAAENFKRNNMDIQRYYYKKLALCNNAKMSNEESIERIVEGLGDFRFNNFLGPLRKYNTPGQLLIDLREADRLVTRYQSNKAQNSGQHNANKGRTFEWRNNNPKIKLNDNKENSVSKVNKSSIELNGVTCFVCNERGHFARQCPNKKKKTEILKTTAHQYTNTHAKYIKTAFINSKPVQCFVDLGSSVTLIREADAKQLQITYFENGFPPVTGYGGGKVVPIGIFTCTIKIDDVESKCEVKVVPDEAQQFPMLVGHQFTEQPHIKIVSDKRGLHITNIEVRNNEELEQNDFKSEITLVEDTIIPKNSVMHIMAQADEADTEWMIEGGIRDNGEAIPRCIVKSDSSGQIMIPYANLTEVDINKSKHMRITRAEKCREAESTSNDDVKREADSTSQVKKEMIQKIITELVGKDINKLYTLLYEYRDRITTNLNNIGLTDKTELKITLVDDIPVYYRPYRLAFAEREWVKNHVDELKTADIVEDSVSDYASPIILVKKKKNQVNYA